MQFRAHHISFPAKEFTTCFECPKTIVKMFRNQDTVWPLLQQCPVKLLAKLPALEPFSLTSWKKIKTVIML